MSWAEEHLFERRSVVAGARDLAITRWSRARLDADSLHELKARNRVARLHPRGECGKLARKDVLAREWKIVQMAEDGRRTSSRRSRRHATARCAANSRDDQQRAFEQILGVSAIS